MPVYKNNGDKLWRRKSIRAADEKLIINELGPNITVTLLWFVDVPLKGLMLMKFAFCLHLSLTMY